MVCFGLLCVLHAWTVSLACEENQFLTEGRSCCDPCASGKTYCRLTYFYAIPSL